MCQTQCVFNLVLLSFCVYFANCFNVDSVNYAAFSGPDRSMFGFSMALHKLRGRSWLIVGAPEAQSTYQPTVIRGGAVYQCSTDSSGSCNEIPFDTQGNNRNADFDWDNKTEQWFGATVSSSGTENGRIVACAPRYTWHPKKMARRDPVGTCYVSNEQLTQFNEYAPCRTFQWGYHRQGSCQAGLSAAVNSRKDRLFIGAPGSCYWQGEMYSIDAHEQFKFKPETFNATFGEKGQVQHQSLDSRPAVFHTATRSQDYDNTYMGYSLIAGNFFNSTEDGVAVGIPRDNGLRGIVKIMTWNLTEFDSFTSDQVGSYFGYALAASDVDGDGELDLVVGAPMYTEANNKGKWDVGRVYVFYQRSEKGRFVAKEWIDGFKSRSRFGQALASLGDMNQDGFGDFAVGAPYDGPHLQGAVYIYHGSVTGLRKLYSQAIYAEDITPVAIGRLPTFGFSLAGGLDLDDNDYPDMAIGAYSASKAYFLRARPVVRVDASVNFLARNKQVDIKFDDYVLKSGKKAVRTQIDFCIKYAGRGIPTAIDLDLQYVLDTKKGSHPRMGFVVAENLNVLNETIHLRKDDAERCLTKDVFVLSDIRDKLTSLAAEVKYAMREETRLLYGDPRAPLRPVLDLNSPPSRVDSISIHKECGTDNVCTPNLRLTVTPSVHKYLLGSNEFLYLDVLVANVGEDSYETTLEVRYPESVYYVSFIEGHVESRILCNTQNQTLKCEIGNPIPNDKVVNFKIKWQPGYAQLNSYDFQILVNSTNPEVPFTLNDNRVNISVGIFSSSTLEVRGKSIPAEIFVNSTINADFDFNKAEQFSESEIGPQVFHEYYLRNEGPTTIEEAEVLFTFPARTKTGEDFVYLLEHFTSKPNVRCENINGNYRKFKMEFNRKLIWEKLNLEMKEEQVHSEIGGGRGQTDESIDRIVATSGDSSQIDRKDQMVSKGTANDAEFTTTVSKNNQFHSDGFTQYQSSNATHFRNSSGLYVSSSGELESRPRVGQSSQKVGGSGGGGSSSSYWHQASSSEGSKRPTSWNQGATSNSGQNWGGTSSWNRTNSQGSNWNHNQAGGGQTGSNQRNGSYHQVGSGGSQSGTNEGGQVSGSYYGGGSTNQGTLQTGGLYHGSSSTSHGTQQTDGSYQGSGSATTVSQGNQQTGGSYYGTGSSSGTNQGSVQTGGSYQGNGAVSQGTQQTGGSYQGSGSVSQGTQQTGGSYYGGGAYNQGNAANRSQTGTNYQTSSGASRSSQSGGSYQTGAGSAWNQSGSNVQVTTTNRCYEDLNGVRREVGCGPNGELPPFNASHYGYYGTLRPVGSSINIYRECFKTINGVERQVDCSTITGYNSTSDTFTNRQREGAHAAGQVQTSVDEFTRQQEYQRRLEEHKRKEEEWRRTEEKRRAEEAVRIESERQRLVEEQRRAEIGRQVEEQRRLAEQRIVEERRRVEEERRWTEERKRVEEEQQRRNKQYGHQAGNNDNNNNNNDEYYEESYEDYTNSNAGGAHQVPQSVPVNNNRQEAQNNRQNTAIGAVGGGSRNNGQFAVGTLDLGEASGAAASGGGRVSGGGVVSGGERGSGGGASGGGAMSSGGSARRGEWSQEGHWSETRQIPPTYFNSVERDNVATDRPTNKRFYGRKKRDVDLEAVEKPQCESMKCLTVRCTIMQLGDKEDVTFVFRSRVNSRVIKSLSNSESLKFSSLMEAKINRLPYIGEPLEQTRFISETFTTVSSSETKLKPDVVPLWIIVLSAVAGILILLLIIYCFSKLGFFNRNRRTDTAETQPLQSNGYHDDAHL